MGAIENLSWSVYYDSWAHASSNKATAFVLGGGALIQKLGLNPELAKTLMAVLVIAFAATTLDTATRIQRFIITEIGQAIRVKPLTNRYLATVIAVLPALFLVFMNMTDPTTGDVKQAGWILWPIFGASNQMLAALTLLVMTLYFWQRKKQVIALILPMIFIMLVTLSTLLMKLQSFYGSNPLLFILNLLLTGLILWIVAEGLLVVRRIQKSEGEIMESGL